MKKVNYEFTHAVVRCNDTIIAQFSAGNDKSAAILARAIVKRAMAETSKGDIPYKREDFRLIPRQYKTFYK